MSRSYKKFPLSKCEHSCKVGKKIANNKVRAYLKSGKEVSNRKQYKKIYNSWDICDHKCSMTLREYEIFYGEDFRKKHKISLKELYYDWYKSYKMK